MEIMPTSIPEHLTTAGPQANRTKVVKCTDHNWTFVLTTKAPLKKE
jgi:hypothetical protein